VGEVRIIMRRILILLAVYIFFSTTFVFLLTSGLLNPLPSVPVFFILMLVFGVAVLRSPGFASPISHPSESKIAWRYQVFLIWAMVSFGGAFYGVLLWISGHGDRGDLGGAIGAAIWGFVLVWVLRIIKKKNQRSVSG
jgi:hypothetical protein